MYEITPPCYGINTWILYRLYFKLHGFLKKDLIGYTHASFRHASTFGCRNIAFQIWWIPCNPHRSKWPKTFCGRCISSTDVQWNNFSWPAFPPEQFSIFPATIGRDIPDSKVHGANMGPIWVCYVGPTNLAIRNVDWPCGKIFAGGNHI